jgi:NAD(P)-dependent dehydrogenase (short-subunit alcohol dehydrogenase family)
MSGRDPILITGCSTGIGRATASRLVAAGHTVYATARRPETLGELTSAGARALALDVTDSRSMTEAVALVEAEHGSVGTLVNNAGFGTYGPVEEVPLDDIRRQFETNVFGLGRMCQLVLPGMRRAGGGRIVNISSMGGRIVFPTGGWYHASKYAVEAMSDALRVEVAPFGVDVVLVEPGLVRSGFESVASGTLAGTAGGNYERLRRRADTVMRRSYRSRTAIDPGTAAAAIHRVVETHRPRARYLITPAARALVHTRQLTGDRLWDLIMRTVYRWR